MDIRKKSHVIRIGSRNQTIIPKAVAICQPDQRIMKYRNSGVGKRLIILGNGPSLNLISVKKTKELQLVTMGVNNVHNDFWQPDYWSVNDTQKANELHADLIRYNGVMFSVLPQKKICGEFIKLKNVQGKWSNELNNGVVLGRSTVFLCLQVAFWMNFDKIFVAGIDMNPHEVGDLHFYGTNKTVDPKKRKERFANEAICYDNMISSLDASSLSKITLCVKGINPWPFATKLNNITPDEFNNL